MSYLPFGGVHTTTGDPIKLRFPGRWFQSENGLDQNWMRDYDPNTGRYMQADPLGLVDGASVYGYARQNPGRYVDQLGLDTLVVIGNGILSNPFGHASIAVSGSGIYSFGTATEWGSSVQDFLYQQSQYRGSNTILIPTSPEQEQAILNSLQNMVLNNKPYDLQANNCATMVMQSLDAADLPNGLLTAMGAGVATWPYYTPRNAGMLAMSQQGTTVIRVFQGQTDFGSFSEFDPK